MTPAFSCRKLKHFFVGPLQKPKPEKLGLPGMEPRILSRVFEEARGTLLKNSDSRFRNESLCLDDQTEPIGKRSPLDELSDGFGQSVRRNMLGLVLCKLARSAPQVEFSLPELGKTLHWGLEQTRCKGLLTLDPPDLGMQGPKRFVRAALRIDPDQCSATFRTILTEIEKLYEPTDTLALR